jgi:hypothetical protein
MNPDPVDDSRHEEAEAAAELQAVAEDYEDDKEELEDDDSGDEDDNDDDSESEAEEGDDSTKESIPIAASSGPLATEPDDGTAAASTSRSIAIPVLIHPSCPHPVSAAGDAGLSSPVSAPPGPASKSAASSAKPRSKKPRSPSPSPPPALPAPPLTTIRLEIKLGGPEKYEIDVSKMAKDSGQRPPTPPPRITVTKHSVSESEQETDGGKKKKRRVSPRLLLICRDA